MVPYVDMTVLCQSVCLNFMRNLCDAAYMSCDVAAIPFQANTNLKK